MNHEFWRSPSKIIPKVEEMQDIQERNKYCQAGTGQRPQPWEDNDDDDDDIINFYIPVTPIAEKE